MARKKPEPRRGTQIFVIVLAFAGDSTITIFHVVQWGLREK